LNLKNNQFYIRKIPNPYDDKFAIDYIPTDNKYYNTRYVTTYWKYNSRDLGLLEKWSPFEREIID